MKGFVQLSKLPAAMARAFYISSRKHRDLESRFTRDMRRLRQRLAQGPHATETPLQFYDRLLDQAEMILERYRGYFTQLRSDASSRSGRPRRIDREPRNRRGGRPKALAAHVAALAIKNRRPVPAVARGVFMAELQKANPKRSQELERARRDYQREHSLSSEDALIRVFGDNRFSAERTELDNLIRTSRNHMKRRRSVER
jgi:hypothetical protein